MKRLFFLLMILSILSTSHGQTRPDIRDITFPTEIIYVAQKATVKGDGITNDGPAISALIASAPAGAVLHFPQKTYAINTPIVMRSNVTLQGTGKPDYYIGTRFLAASSTTCILQFTDAGNGTCERLVVIKNIGFRGAAWNSTTSGMFGALNTSVIEDCFFSDLDVGINLYSTTNKITRCTFSGGYSTIGKGIILRRSNEVTPETSNYTTIQDCSFGYTVAVNRGSVEIDAGSKNSIVGCQFEGIMNTPIILHGGNSITIDRCYFERVNAPYIGYTASGNSIVKTDLGDPLIGCFNIVFSNNYHFFLAGCLTEYVVSGVGSNVSIHDNLFARGNLALTSDGFVSSAYDNSVIAGTWNGFLEKPQEKEGLTKDPWLKASLTSIGYTTKQTGTETVSVASSTLVPGDVITITGDGSGYTGISFPLSPTPFYAGRRIGVRILYSDAINTSDAIFVGLSSGPSSDLASASNTVTRTAASNLTPASPTTNITELATTLLAPLSPGANLMVVVMGSVGSAKIHAVEWWVMPPEEYETISDGRYKYYAVPFFLNQGRLNF